ncbi:hypothetical protein CLOP_g18688 [Closterium sp. NIES-67]|nr:hypothetical protein CLOP_g18688 [Closterium sp. NIES-67]
MLCHTTGKNAETSSSSGWARCSLGNTKEPHSHVERVPRHGKQGRGGQWGTREQLTERLSQGEAVAGVLVQQTAHHVLARLAHTLPLGRAERHVLGADGVEDAVVATRPERRVPRHHHKQHHPRAPHVRLGPIRARQHLGRHVVRSADQLRQRLARLEARRHTKVDQPDLHAPAAPPTPAALFPRGPAARGPLGQAVGRYEQDVLGLDIAVHHALPVAEGQCCQQLLQHRGRAALAEPAALFYAVEEVAAAADLHDNVHVAVVLKGAVDLDDVGVRLEQLHHRHLLAHVLRVLRCLHRAMPTQGDDAVGMRGGWSSDWKHGSKNRGQGTQQG